MPKTFSPHLAKSARQKLGLGQREAARRMGIVRQTLINAESGLSTPGGETLAAMSQLYGIPIDSLYIVHDETDGSGSAELVGQGVEDAA